MKRLLVSSLFIIALSLIGCANQAIKHKENKMAETAKPAPKVNIKFIFSMCNDVEKMSEFYTKLLGMQEQAFMNDKENKFGYLSYYCTGDVYLMFFSTETPAPQLTDWAWQPGYEGGNLMATSWAIEIPEEDYPATIKRLKDAGVKAFSENPEWRQDSYWGFSVADPQGNTVEVYTSPKEKPKSPSWPGEKGVV